MLLSLINFERKFLPSSEHASAYLSAFTTPGRVFEKDNSSSVATALLMFVQQSQIIRAPLEFPAAVCFIVFSKK